jgi:hypothetical protein
MIVAVFVKTINESTSSFAFSDGISGNLGMLDFI